MCVRSCRYRVGWFPDWPIGARDGGFELSGAFGAPGHSAVGEDIVAAIGGLPTGTGWHGTAEVLGGADVVIDFTTAAAS